MVGFIELLNINNLQEGNLLQIVVYLIALFLTVSLLLTTEILLSASFALRIIFWILPLISA